MRDLIVTKDKAPHLPNVRGADAGTGGQPLKTYTEFFEWLRQGVKRDRFLAVIRAVDTEMILQILAHPRQINLRCDVHRIQGIGRPNPRQHQELGALDGATTDDDFFGGKGLFDLAVHFILNAARLVVFKNDAMGQGPGLQSEVRTFERRF